MDVTVIRSKRKTLSLRVGCHGEVLVRAPYRTGEQQIRDFIARHEEWIAARISECLREQFQIEDGAIVSLFEKEYVIQNGRARMEDGLIFLPCENREKALICLLKKFALNYMTSEVRRLAERYGFRYEGVQISSARGRWGSCGKQGKITFSFRIVFLTEELARYVAVHELCHTRHFNHSADFWREVGGILPDYQTCRNRLKSCGTYMNRL